MSNYEQKENYFLKLEIEGFRCFKQRVTLDFSGNSNKWKKWTVILGDNSTGKTTVLQLLAAIAAGFSYNIKDSPNFYNAFSLFEGLNLNSSNNNGEVDAWIYDFARFEKTTKQYKGDLGLIFKEGQLSGYTAGENKLSHTLNCFGYGANRFMSLNTLTESKSINSKTLFNEDAKLINAEEWLLQLDYAASKDTQVKEYAEKRRHLVEQVILKILPDVTGLRYSTPTKDNLRQSIEFETCYNWVGIRELSLGYKTMVAWMVDLAARLFDLYPNSENPLAEAAIVIVDEIDLHLHPQWQRRIFAYLDELFPNTQFIVTAHSPLVVQSAPVDANLVLLKREGDHVIIDQDIKSVHSWRLDQILSSDLFGVGNRSTDIENMMQERTKLLQKRNLSQKEKGRLKELNEVAHNLPTADNQTDMEAMEIIRRAADYLKNK